MKYFNFLFLLFFITVTACAQSETKPESTFIPRELLMQDADIFDVQLSTNGKTVYFKRSGGSDTIFYRSPEETTLIKHIVFPEAVKSYSPTFNGGSLAISENAKIFAPLIGKGVTCLTLEPLAK